MVLKYVFWSLSWAFRPELTVVTVALAHFQEEGPVNKMSHHGGWDGHGMEGNEEFAFVSCCLQRKFLGFNVSVLSADTRR